MNWLLRRRELIAVQSDADGTKFYIQFTAANQKMTLGYTQTIAGDTTVYWGDGTQDTPDTTTVSLSHTYTNNAGDTKTITIVGKQGTYAFNSFAVKNTLTEFKGYGGITSIGDSAFKNCTALTEVNLPSTLTTIAGGVFNGCTALSEIILPEGLERLGYSSYASDAAILSCSSLAYAYLPSTLKWVERDFSRRGDGLFSKCPLLTTVGPKDGGYTVEYGTWTQVPSHFLDGNNIAENVVLVEPITSIGDSAFKNCTALTEVNLPSSLTSIGSSAFNGCTALTEVSLPSSLTSIGGSAFNGCTALSEIHCLRATPPTISSSTFASLPTTCTIYVPTGSLEAYQTAQYWSEYAAQMVEE